MKLHLPYRLRKALLACLAALALPATLPSTLCTASGVAALSYLVGAQARADNLTVGPEQAQGNGPTASGDASYDNLILGGSTSGDYKGLCLSTHTVTITGELQDTSDQNYDFRVDGEGTLVLEGGGTMGGTFAAFNKAHIKLGTASESATLSVGKLGGNEFYIEAAGDQEVTLKITAGDETAGALGQNGAHSSIGNHVTVDLTGTEGAGVTQRFSGVDFAVGSRVELGTGSVLEFNNVKWGDNVSSFAGTLDGSGTLKVDGSSVEHNAYTDQDATKHRLEWSGSTADGYSGTLEVGGNGILKMTTGFATTGSVTLASGAVVQMTSGTLKAGTLTLADGNATLEITLTGDSGPKLSFNSIEPNNGTLTIKLTGWDEFAAEGYQLFDDADGQWANLWNSIQGSWTQIFHFQNANGEALSVKLGEDGKLVSAEEPLYWGAGDAGNTLTLGSGSGDVWSATSGSHGTTSWAEGKDVHLEAASGDVTVTVGDGATMNTLKIAKGSATYTFTAGAEKTLTVTNGLTIGSNSTFGNNVAVAVGTATVDGGTVKFGSGSKLTAGKLTISGAGTVVEFGSAEGSVNVTGTLENQVAGSKVTAVMGDGGIVLRDGATLKLTSNVFSNLAYVQGDGTVDIDMSGNQTGMWNNWFGYLFPAVEYNKSTGNGITLQLTNSTHLTLEGQLGDRLQNIKTFNITDGSSVIVATKGTGPDLFSLGEGHTLSISGTGGEGDPGALQFGKDETIAWAFVLTGDATISSTAVTTLTGEMNAAGNTLTKKGAGDLVLSTGFTTKESTSGTLNVTEGALKLNYGTSEALSGYAVQLESGATMESGITGAVKTLAASGGILNVSSGKLTLTEGINGSLTTLTLGDNATLGVERGSEGGFTIESAWNWGTSCTLRLGSTITLGVSVSLSGNSQQLTIDLSSSFLGDGMTKGEKQLFTSGFKGDWVGYFTFLVDGEEVGTDWYDSLALDASGKLTWGKEAQLGDTLYWGTGDGDNTLTLGAGGDEWSTTQGGSGSQGWEADKFVVLESNAAGGVATVKVAEGGASMKTLTLNGSVTYNFTTDAATAQTVTVQGGLTNNATGLTIGANVTLSVGGNYSGNGGLGFGDGVSTVGENAYTWDPTAVLTLAKDATLGAIDMSKGSGSITMADNTTVTLGELTGEGAVRALVLGATGKAQSAAGNNITVKMVASTATGVKLFVNNGVNVQLGGTLEVGGLGGWGGKFTVEGTDDVDLVLNVADTATAVNLTTGEHVNLVKDGAGTQSIIVGSSASYDKHVLQGAITVKGGVLDFEGTVEQSDGAITVNSGATLNFNAQGDHANRSTLSLGGNIAIEGGILSIKGFADSTIDGVFQKGNGGGGTLSLSTYDKATTGTGSVVEHTLTLSGGGTTGAKMQLLAEGAKVVLGTDLEVGGLTQDAALTAGRSRSINGSGVTLTVNVASSGSESISSLTIGEGVTLKKTGDGAQTLTDASVAGDVTVEAGELAFSSTGGMSIGGNVVLNGGTLSWTGGTLTITGQLSTSSGASLKITKGSGTPTLSVVNGLTGELHLTFSDFVVTDFQNGGYQLFDSQHWQSEWKDQIKLDFGELEMQGGSIEFNDSGALVWAAATQPSGGDLYWPGSSAGDQDLTLGGSGANEWSNTSGGTPDQTWANDRNVYLEAVSGEIAVTVAESVSMASLSLSGGATYNFAASAAQTVTVSGNLQNNAAGLNIGQNVTLSVGGTYSGSGKLGFADGVSTGSTHTWNPTAVLTLANGASLGDIDLSRGSGSITMADNTTVTLGTLTGGDTVHALVLGATGKTQGDGDDYKGTNITVKLAGGTADKVKLFVNNWVNVQLSGTLQVGGLGGWGSTFNTEEAGGVDLVLNVTEASQVVNLTTGEHVNLVKQGGETQKIIVGSAGSGDRITLKGNVTVEEGTLDTTGVSLISGDVTIADGASLLLTGSGAGDKHIALTLGDTSDSTIAINGGTLTIKGFANSTVNGTLTGSGGILAISTWGQDADEQEFSLTFSGGGTTGAKMQLLAEGAKVALGANLEVGGLTQDAALTAKRSRSITKSGDADVSLTVNVADSASISSLSTGAGVTLKKTGDGTQTLDGATIGGGLAVDGGILEFTGTSSVTGALSSAGNGGKVKITSGTTTLSGGGNFEGTLEMAGGSVAAGNGLTVGTLSGQGALSVTGGTLTVGTVADGATLTTLALTGNLEVQAGSFTISGGLTWVEGGSLTLGGSRQTITLSGDSWAQTLATALEAASGQMLTIRLGADFLTGVSGTSFDLFTGADGIDFTQYFDVNVDALSATYEGLTFNANGKLTWGSTEQGGDGLYWPGSNAGDRELTLGGAGTNEWSGTEGGALDQSWGEGKNVYLKAADGSVTVTVAEGATMASLHLDGGATYNFTAGAKQKVTVTGDMVNNADGLSVGANVTLSVGGAYTGSGDVTVNGGLLEFSGAGNTVKGNVTVEGATVNDSDTPNIGILFGGATVIEGEFHLTGNTGLYNSLTLKQGGTVSGTFNVSWQGNLTLGGDLVVGNLARGTADSDNHHDGWTRVIEREGSAKDHNVYILFSEEGGHAGDLSAMYDAFRAKANGEANHETIGEGVGYGIAGKDAGSNVTLSLAETSETGYDFKIRGGQVTLDGGTALTVGTADAKKTLELVGAKLVLGEHTLSAETLIVGGKSTISLTMGEQTAGVLSLGGLRFGGDGSLTIQLADFTAGGIHDDFLLFGGEGVSSWLTDEAIGKFSFVDSSGTAIDDVTLETTGVLTWGGEEGPVEPGPGGDTEPGGDVFWGGGEGESGLTWGSTEDDRDFDTKPDGSGDVGWEDGTNVHFLGKGSDESRPVQLAGNIKTGDFDATGTEGQAEFSFGTDAENTSRKLEVGGNMSVTHAELTFTKDVNLTVEGSVTLEDGTLSVEGEAEFKGEVSGTGILDTGADGRISLSRTGEGGFKGKVTGTGTLATAESGQVTLSGDVSGFGGTLDIGAGGTLTLSGDAVGDEVSVKAGGSGTLAVESAESGTYFTGSVGTGDDSLTLTNTGAGMLYVGAGAESAAGAKLNGGTGGITLGDSGNVAAWNGREVTGGDITLSNVTLAKGGLQKTTTGAKVYVDTALAAGINTVAREATPQGGVVDVAGMDAGDLDGIKVNAHGQLTEVTGTYRVGANKQLTLHFTEENVVGSGEAKGLIVGRHVEGKEDFSIEFSGSGEAAEQGLHLEFDEAAIIEALRKGGEGEALNLRALENGTWDAEEKGVTIDWTKLGLMDIYVTGVEFTDVGLKIAGSTRDLYVVLDGKESDSHESTAPGDMAEKLATVVTAGQTLTLNWAEDGTVRNLVGAEGAKLEIKDASGQGLTVTLDNTHYETVHDDRYPEAELPRPEETTVQGQDTAFLGSINGGRGVDIVKSGLGTLTVGGDYALADGDTRLEAGALRLRGTGNRMSSLTFAYGTAQGTDEARGLLLAAGSRTEVGSIVEATDAVNTEGNEVTLSRSAELTLTGESTLANTAISFDDAHGGVLHLREGASLSFTGDKGIGGTAVDMQNATLDLGKSKSTLTELSGSGTLRSSAGGEVTVGGGSFTGTLGSSVEGAGAGTLVVADGASFTLDNAKSVTSAPEQGMDVRLEGKSHLTVKVGGKQGDGTDTLNFGDIELGGGQLTVDFGGRGINEKYVKGNVTGVGEGGVLEFVSNGTVKDDTIHTGFTVEEGLRGQEKLKEFVQFSGVDNLLNDHTVGVTEEGEVVLTLQAVEENRLAELIPGAQKNGMAGAEMMWGSLKGRSQGELLSDIFARPDSAYARLAFYLSQCYESKNADGLDRTLAAAAGSAISTLGAALGQDVHRQLSSIRNRTTGMGGAAHGVSDKLPQWHAWIQGEGNYHKLDADGLAPGYTLNSWGGTVGVDADVTRRMTLGLAVTAMYGDLKPDSVDSATGDLDTAYLSAFARVAHGAWIHTFAVSGGFADVKLDRTVSYNGGSYRTSGSTDGYALGVLYEVGYTRLMNAAGTVALQPVFNVEWRHASIDGYTESGCDAGVSTDDITQDVVTFGAGARAQFAVGSNVFNHAAVLETRALVKADVGDRSGTASNAMVGDTARAEVESAEVGTVGVELGAGISVPIGSDTGSVFVDGSVEFRSGWTSANATVGYRMNF